MKKLVAYFSATGTTQNLAENLAKAVGANPICIIVPCHRVVGKTGNWLAMVGNRKQKATTIA